MADDHQSIPHDAHAPRTPEERYGLYVVAHRGARPELVCTAPDGGGIGVALFQQDADALEAGGPPFASRGSVGVLDRIERRWIVNPYAGGPRR